MFMRYLLISLLVFMLPQSVHSQNGAASKIKAMWVVRDILKSKTDIRKMLADAETAKITDLFVQVRGRSDAYYKSDLVPMADGLDGSFDPLQYLLNQADGKVRVHAWMNVFYLWSSESKPAAKEHLLYTHPEWSAVSSTGLSMLGEGLKKLKDKNKEGYFISPANEAFKDHFLAVVGEVIDRYAVDGIHLDYIRYAGREYDYSESIRSKFMLDYHLDPFRADSLSSQKRIEFEKTWADYRRGEISDFVERIALKVRSARKPMVLSAAVWADLEMATSEMMQDWPLWIREGYLDLAVPMNYAADNKVFQKRIKDAETVLGDSLMTAKVVTGISLYNQSSSSMAEKAEICRTLPMAGISFFSYESVRKDRNYFQKMADTRY